VHPALLISFPTTVGAGVVPPFNYPRPISKSENPFMLVLFVFFYWKTLNRRFGVRARHKSPSHDFWKINDMRDLIPFLGL
jgi:hypothetical protein